MKVMKFKGDDGKEVEMKFDFKMLEEKDGVMKMIVNGEEMEIKIDDLHQHMGKIHEHMGEIHGEPGNVEVMIKNDENDEEPHTI